MRKLYYILLSLVFFTSCETSEQEVDSVIKLTGGTLTTQVFYADETQKPAGIQFNAIYKWTAEVVKAADANRAADLDWLKLSAYEGEAGDNSITLNFTANKTNSERKAEVKFYCGDKTVSVIVVQKSVTQSGASIFVVQIPDAAFKAYLLESFDENKNGEMESTEMSEILEIHIVNPEIKSLVGVEYCKNLGKVVIRNTSIEIFDFSNFEYLGCAVIDCPQAINVEIISTTMTDLMLENLTKEMSVDFSSCVNLTNISFLKTTSNHVDLSNHTKLKYLNLQDIMGSIFSLDLSKFVQLEGLVINNVSFIEFTMANPNLTSFVCDNARVPIIDLSYSEKLNGDNVFIYGNNFIERINFGNLEFSTKTHDEPQFKLITVAPELTIISENLKSFRVKGTRVEELDLSGCKSMEWLALNDYSFDLSDPKKEVIEGTMNVKAPESLQRITMASSGYNELNLTDSKSVGGLVIDGHVAKSFKLIGAGKMSVIELWNSTKVESVDISGSPSLKTLQSYYMEALKSFDVSGCTSLEEANVSNSKTLDLFTLKGCTSLNKLFCSMNGIKELNVDGCSSLAQLWCSANLMKTLDLSTCNIFNDSYLFPDLYPLQCCMPSLETIYLKTGWKINGINVYPKDTYIHSATKIEYK